MNYHERWTQEVDSLLAEALEIIQELRTARVERSDASEWLPSRPVASERLEARLVPPVERPIQ